MDHNDQADAEDRDYCTDKFLDEMEELREKLAALRAEVERLREERDRQYDQNTEQIVRIASLEAEVARLREERRWIPVEERLPVTGRHLATDGYRVWTAFWLDCRWTDPMSSGDPQPTHWQPLPAPPEEVK